MHTYDRRVRPYLMSSEPPRHLADEGGFSAETTPETMVPKEALPKEPSDRYRLRKWLLALLLFIVLGSTLSLFVLKRHFKRAALLPVSEQVSSLSLLNLELQESVFFKEWKEHLFHHRTLYRIEVGADGKRVLHALSQGGSSVLFKQVNVKVTERPFLAWEWKTVQFPSNKKNEILAQKSDNDFAARVYAVFQGRTSLTSHVIQYVWDDHFPEGTYAESPYAKKTKIFVVQSGPVNAAPDWMIEKRDLVSDYEMLFGKPPRGNLIAIGLMSDSDNTGTVSEAYFRHLAIQKPQADPSN